MTPNDISLVLERLPFHRGGRPGQLLPLLLDKDARDFIVAALQRR